MDDVFTSPAPGWLKGVRVLMTVLNVLISQNAVDWVGHHQAKRLPWVPLRAAGNKFSFPLLTATHEFIM